MPQIPQAEARAPFPLVPVSPGMAAIPAESQERAARETGRIAEQVGTTAQYGAQVYDFLQRAQDNVEALKIKNSVAADFDEEAQKYLLRGDYKNFETDAAQFNENTRKKYDAIVGKNPQLQKAVGVYFDIQSRKFNHIIRLKQAHEIQKEGQTQFLMDLDYTAGQIAGEPDPDRKEFMKNELAQETEYLIGSHVLDRVWAYEKLKGVDVKAEETEIVNGVKSLDVATVEGMVDRLNQKNSFPNVDPVKKANFQAFGEQRIESLSKKYQAEVDKVQITKGFKGLKEKFTTGEDTDYNAMSKELRSPAFQKDYTLSQIESIQRGINSEESAVAKEKKDARDKEESDIQRKISLGTATHSEIRNAKYLSAEDKQKWEIALDKRLKKGDEDITPGEDSRDYIRINNLIDLEADPKVIKDAIASSTHLKTGTRQKLFDRVDTHIEAPIKTGEKRGNDYLHKQIAPAKSAFELAKPEEEARSAKAQQALSDWISTQKKLAASGKRAPVSEKEIFDKAVEMAPYYKMGFSDQMEWYSKQMEEEARKARPKSATPSKKDQYGFETGETRTINEVTRKYIGNNQWQGM